MAVVNFDELIGTKTFDAAFKNTIRDYYVYGFKSSKMNLVKVHLQLKTDGRL